MRADLSKGIACAVWDPYKTPLQPPADVRLLDIQKDRRGVRYCNFVTSVQECLEFHLDDWPIESAKCRLIQLRIMIQLRILDKTNNQYEF